MPPPDRLLLVSSGLILIITPLFSPQFKLSSIPSFTHCNTLFPGKCRSVPASPALSTLCLVRNARHKHIVLLISYLYLYLDSNETKTTHTHNTHISKLKICWVFSTQPISPPLTFENLCSGSFDKHVVLVTVSKCCFCKI